MSNMARVLLTAPASGSGKTMLTCGLIAALKNRQLNIAACKCGPDYIDPMFHRKVLGVSAGNLDSYFTDKSVLCSLLAKKAKAVDVTVLEGVMGYYDGLGGVSEQASTYEVAKWTKTPAVLIIDCKGASVTLTATIKGLCEFREDSGIAGVILNRISEGYYAKIKHVIETECNIPVVGYVPVLKDMEIPSRHLGLHAPEEVEAFSAWTRKLVDVMEQTLDLNQILEIANEAPKLDETELVQDVEVHDVTIAVARDEAFSFYYDENIELLEKMGAKLTYFSPLHDTKLPDVDGLILGGGYPELFAKELSANVSMRASVKEACESGLPCIAECGGFLYLQQTLEGEDGNVYPMCGVLVGEGFRTSKLQRFGYMEAKLDVPGGMLGDNLVMKGHEFHYWDCTENGASAVACKPTMRDKTYRCIVHTKTMFAGFPHFYYYSNQGAIFNYMIACEEYKDR